MINKVAFTGKAEPLTKTVAKTAEKVEAKIVKASMDLTGTKNAAEIVAPQQVVYASPFASIVDLAKPAVQAPVINRTGLDFFA